MAVGISARELAARLEQSDTRLTSPIAIFEAVAGVARVLALPVAEARDAVAEFLGLMSIDVVAVPAELAPRAVDAFARYGKSQGHPGRLNLGDCFAYACARHFAVPLLFKGGDFTLTDIDEPNQ